MGSYSAVRTTLRPLKRFTIKERNGVSPKRAGVEKSGEAERVIESEVGRDRKRERQKKEIKR